MPFTRQQALWVVSEALEALKGSTPDKRQNQCMMNDLSTMSRRLYMTEFGQEPPENLRARILDPSGDLDLVIDSRTLIGLFDAKPQTSE